ncbi:MAG: ribosome recycling factor [Deltaproteobacteria bacterium]
MGTKEAIFSELGKRLGKAIDAFNHELSGLRTGRASIAILDGIRVDFYGTQTPLKQIATMSVPETRTIVIQPWDISQIAAVEKAILASDLGLTPSNDGKVIRINLPLLNEERRKEIVKIARRFAEETRVAVRNARRDANEALKKLEKDKKVSQDELKASLAEVQDTTDKQIHKIDEFLKAKEAEIMEV